jgi:hypothetical protein
MKRSLAFIVAFAAVIASASISVQPVAAQAFAPPVFLNDNQQDKIVTVEPGATVTVSIDGPVLPYHDWRVTWVFAECNDNEHVRPSGGAGNFACFDESLRPKLNALGNGYIAQVQAPAVETSVSITYAYFPPYIIGAGEANDPIKIYHLTVVVGPKP